MSDLAHTEFMDRHGSKCFRHPARNGLWLFADGATLVEESWRGGETVVKEPSPDPMTRLEVQLKFRDLEYAAVWKEFTRAEANYDVEQMKARGEELASIQTEISALNKAWNDLPELRERRRLEADKENRDQLVETIKRERDRQIRDDANKISMAVRTALPVPSHPHLDPMQKYTPATETPSHNALTLLTETLAMFADRTTRMSRVRSRRG